MLEQIFSPQNLEIFGQLGLATILGALIGVERELARKTAGMRTFALVAMGAALFTILSHSQLGGPQAPVGYDPSRIASQIVVGIGFIGGGAIVFTKSQVKGLTTAAGLWVSAAIGMAVGYRFYPMAIFSTLVTIFILVFLWFMENHIIKKLGSVAARDDDGDQ